MVNTGNPLPKCPSTPNCERVTISFEQDSNTVFLALNEVLEKMNAEKITKDEDSYQVDAVFRIPVFGYKDDVAIALKTGSDSTTVFIRSASREGYWDIWVNKIRVKRIIKRIKQTLSN